MPPKEATAKDKAKPSSSAKAGVKASKVVPAGEESDQPKGIKFNDKPISHEESKEGHPPKATDASKKQKDKRAAAEEEALADILKAYDDNPNPDIPPPIPPRGKKLPLYKCRKCL
jgi:hypothetical protein